MSRKSCQSHTDYISFFANFFPYFLFFYYLPISRIEQTATLRVDNGPIVTGASPGKLRQLNGNGHVFIGKENDLLYQQKIFSWNKKQKIHIELHEKKKLKNSIFKMCFHGFFLIFFHRWSWRSGTITRATISLWTYWLHIRTQYRQTVCHWPFESRKKWSKCRQM